MTTRVRTPGGIPASALAANISAGVTSLTLTTGDGANWPSTFPFDIIVNRGSVTSRERIRVGGRTTDTLNSLTRGIDGTTAQAHNLGDSVEVAVAGSYLDELGQLLGGAAGDLYYYDGTALQKLAKGTARQRLLSGTAPAWSYTSVPIYADATARDAEITAPSSGMAAYLDTGATSEGLYFYNGTSWRLPWNMPWGVVAQVSSTSNQTGITTSVDVTFATLTWTAITGRLYRITLNVLTSQLTTSATQTLDIESGASGAGTILGITNSHQVPASSQGTGNVIAYQTGSGSISVHARAAATVGTMTIGNATVKGWIVAEDVGPTGNPL